MDPNSADIILSLQAQDLAELDRDLKIDEKDTGNADLKLALEYYEEELRHAAFLMRDHAYGQKVGEADNSGPPSPLISPTPDFDRISAALATSLTIRDGASSTNQSNGDGIQTAVTLEDSDTASEEGNLGIHCREPSIDVGVQDDMNNDDENQPVVYSCVACNMCEEENDMVHVPCGDYYCKHCTIQLFSLSMKDESLFPPRCCRQPIPLELVSIVLGAELQENFEHKAIEFFTADRTYCSQSTCGGFIPPISIKNEKATCPECGLITCTTCKNAEHEGDCPANPEHQALMELAAKEGYQKCYQCKRLVEISTGCNHMT